MDTFHPPKKKATFLWPKRTISFFLLHVWPLKLFFRRECSSSLWNREPFCVNAFWADMSSSWKATSFSSWTFLLKGNWLFFYLFFRKIAYWLYKKIGAMSRKIQQKSIFFPAKFFWTSFPHRYPQENGGKRLCTSCLQYVENERWTEDILWDPCARFSKKPINTIVSNFCTVIHLFTSLSTSPYVQAVYEHSYSHYVDNFIHRHVQNLHLKSFRIYITMVECRI